MRGRLADLRVDLFLVAANLLLALPGHRLRLLVFRHMCHVSVGARTSIERGVRVMARGGVSIGAGCNVNAGAVLDGRGTLAIGDLVNISPGVKFITADHDPDSPGFEGRRRPVLVGSRTWIATSALVLPGTTIGEGAVVAAGSVVSGTVDRWTIVAGCPARFVRPRHQGAQACLPSYRRWLH